MSDWEFLELLLRGAAAGAILLLACLVFVSPAPRMRRWLGVLFMIGTFAYILISGDFDRGEDGVDFLNFLAPILKPLAVFNTVFFWWFALSLFDDAFHLTVKRFAPVFVLVLLHPPFPLWQSERAMMVEELLHAAFGVGLMGHAVYVALKNRKDDLVDPRRRFRLVFAVGVGLTGVVISILESVETIKTLPETITVLHAATLFVLVYFFAFWMLSARDAFFAADETAPRLIALPERVQRKTHEPDGGPVRSALDAADLDKLAALMDAGVYREENLTVAVLAEKLALPEHRLRKLINQALGFRNFSAFLNERRIADAKARLCDPARAREQIIQIALDLGYGSVAPFNRAFKAATGATPTQFRRDRLEAGADDPAISA